MCYISEYSTGNVPEIIVRQKVYCKKCHKGMGTIQDVDEPLERQLGQYVSLTTGPVPLNRPTPQLCRFLNLFPLVNGPIFPQLGRLPNVIFINGRRICVTNIRIFSSLFAIELKSRSYNLNVHKN